MTYTEFMTIKVGDKVKANLRARTRFIEHVYDDPCGARILNTSKIQGCSKGIDNLDWKSDSHYSNWRLA